MSADKRGDTSQDRIKQQLEMLDQRLDNLDSVVTSLVERVMRQPISINITCPNCGKNYDISLTGNIRIGSQG